MDDETRAAFGRIDRYFELAQAQHLELRQDIARLDARMGGLEERMGGLEERMGGLEERMGGLEERMGGLEQELRAFRDWVAAEFAELWAVIRQILARLDRLERQRTT